MTEWGVFGVIAALVALGAAIIKPIVGLNNSITRLTTLIDGLSDDLTDLTSKNAQSHDRLWAHNDGQDKQLQDHEMRIGRIEERGAMSAGKGTDK